MLETQIEKENSNQKMHPCSKLKKPVAKMLRHSHEKTTFLASNRC